MNSKQQQNLIYYSGMGIAIFIILSFIFWNISRIQIANPNLSILEGLQMVASGDVKLINPINIQSIKYCGYSFIFSLLLMMSMYFDELRNRRDNAGKEYGSAKWMHESDPGYKKYNKHYSDPIGKPDNSGSKNIILTKKAFLSTDCFKTKRNLNTVVVGGSGTGKSRFMAKPNILQANTSYVITDPAGELLLSTGDFLERQGYSIKCLNLTDMEHSNCYNPFDYIRDDNGVLMLVNCLIKNTNGEKTGGDPFWEKSETALLQALFFYLLEEQPPQNRNFTSVMKLLRAAEIDENDASSKSPLDRIFEDVQLKNPNSLAVKSYQTFKMGAGKTLKSILISCAVRLNTFDLPQVANLVRTDIENPENNLDLSSLGDRKTALFVIIPASDDTYNFIVSMMYYQLFENLYFHAEHHMVDYYTIKSKNGVSLNVKPTLQEANDLIEKYKKSSIKKGGPANRYKLVYKNPETKEEETLEYNKYPNTLKSIREEYANASPKQIKRPALSNHVRFLLDEFANIGQIPDFLKKLSTMRKYEMSCTIILQNLAQIKTMYKDQWGELIGNCDTFLFLGSQETETTKYISEILGDSTQRVRNSSRNMGAKGGSSLSFNQAARKLLTPDEIGKLKNEECILAMRGENPIKDLKYDYLEHKNYKYTGDADSKLNFPSLEYFNNELTTNKNKEIKKTALNEISYEIANNKAEDGTPVFTTRTVDEENVKDAAGINDIRELRNTMKEVYSSSIKYVQEEVEAINKKEQEEKKQRDNEYKKKHKNKNTSTSKNINNMSVSEEEDGTETWEFAVVDE